MTSQRSILKARAGAGAQVAAMLALSCAVLLAAGCKREDMHNQPRHEMHERSDFFADEMASRPPVEGTVAQGQPLRNDPLVMWRVGEKFADTYPAPIDQTALRYGRERYTIYCSMCHGDDGGGNGMVVRRGFVRPPSLHDERLRAAAPGYFVEVISNGYGAMYGYNDRIPAEDRWKIAAYVKTLQLSRKIDLASLPAEDRQEVEQAAAAAAATATQPAGQGNGQVNGRVDAPVEGTRGARQ